MERLKEVINEVLENAGLNKVSDISHKTLLVNDLDMDSLMLAELTVRLEMEFEVDIFESSIVRTVGEILEKLEGAKDE